MHGHNVAMKRYALYLREEQLAFLQSLVTRGFTVSEQIRIAVDNYITNMQKATISSSKSKHDKSNSAQI